MPKGKHKHRISQHRSEWNSYNSAKHRCTNPNFPAFDQYGGRGITMDPEWLESFDAFYDALGPKPSPDHVLARRDFDGNYTKENCFWGTRSYVCNSPNRGNAGCKRARKT